MPIHNINSLFISYVYIKCYAWIHLSRSEAINNNLNHMSSLLTYSYQDKILANSIISSDLYGERKHLQTINTYLNYTWPSHTSWFLTNYKNNRKSQNYQELIWTCVVFNIKFYKPNIVQKYPKNVKTIHWCYLKIHDCSYLCSKIIIQVFTIKWNNKE